MMILSKLEIMIKRIFVNNLILLTIVVVDPNFYHFITIFKGQVARKIPMYPWQLEFSVITICNFA